jgi:hypothetical protein
MIGRADSRIDSSVSGSTETLKMSTGKTPAHDAAKLLANPKTSKVVKTVAGSDLAQRRPNNSDANKKR